MPNGPMAGRRTQRLADYLFDVVDAPELADEMATWLATAPRYRGFVETHRDKIRKKLRTASDGDARRDVRTELRVAQLLLADRGLALTFEPYGSTGGGPDFAVAFRGHRSFDLEVTRMRRDPLTASDGGPVLPKLRQLRAGIANVLLVAVDADARALDVRGAMAELRARADGKDEDFFIRRGFAGTRAFYDRFLRLGAVLVWSDAAAQGERCTTWLNRSARIPVPERALRATASALTGALS